ncbi:hypothetical protein D3C81_2160110 [compost metagenome]
MQQHDGRRGRVARLAIKNIHVADFFKPVVYLRLVGCRHRGGAGAGRHGQGGGGGESGGLDIHGNVLVTFKVSI